MPSFRYTYTNLTPRVSVIIPLFNLQDYVCETIDSVLAQSFEDIDIIVVNDASTDDSVEVIRKRYEFYLAYMSYRIRIVDLKENVGLPAARNIGINESNAEFILPLDADDTIDPRYIEKTGPLMFRDVGVVSTWMSVFGARPDRCGPADSGYPIFSPTREQILAGNTLPVCSLIRRQTLDDVGGYPEEMAEGSEDWALWVKIIQDGRWKVKVLEDYLFNYRTRPGSMSRQATMMPFHQARQKISRLFGSKEAA